MLPANFGDKHVTHDVWKVWKCFKCEAQVKEGCSKLIHKPPTLYVQVEARSTTWMMQLPHKPTCIPVLHSHISDLHTQKQGGRKIVLMQEWRHLMWTQVQDLMSNSVKLSHTSLILSARDEEDIDKQHTHLWTHSDTGKCALHTYMTYLHSHPLAVILVFSSTRTFALHICTFTNTPTHLHTCTLTCICDLVIFTLTSWISQFSITMQVSKFAWSLMT